MANFYPPLATLLPTESLPESLGFVRNGLASLLSDLYFKDFQKNGTPNGDQVNVNLTIVPSRSVEFDLPGLGATLVLNPGAQAQTEFPVTFSYEWGILGLIQDFDLTTFSFGPEAFYQLALSILGLDERQLLAQAVSVLIPGPNPLNAFVDAVNGEYELQPPIAHPAPNTPLPQGVDQVMTAIESQQGLDDAGAIIFAFYIIKTGGENDGLEGAMARLEKLFNGLIGRSLEEMIKDLLVPKFEASMGLGVGLRFSRDVLIPLDQVGGTPQPGEAMLSFDVGDFRFSSTGGFGYDQDMSLSLTPVRIAGTEFDMMIRRARLDLSTETNIPQATADGRGNEFMGIFVEQVEISLPSFFGHNDANSTGILMGQNLLIGTGGFSGTLRLLARNPNQATPPLLAGRFGAFTVALHSFEISFRQNAVTASAIAGSMKIAGFEDTEGNDAEIAIAVGIDGNGDFTVTASEEQGIRALSIPDILDLEIKSLSLGTKGGRFFVTVSGDIDFKAQAGLGDFLPDKVEVHSLTIWDDGKMELKGGGIVLAKPVSMALGPVNFTVTAIHFGTHQEKHEGVDRQYAFFGFDGGISVKPGGVDARGDGIKFYFTTDNGPGKDLHVFLRIESIAVDIIIPGDVTPEAAAVLIKGYLSLKGGGEYLGGVQVSLPKLQMAGGAEMRLKPQKPAFAVDMNLELAVPIVLGATGLGIYGFRGLLGMRYIASKEAANLQNDAQWWRYYKAKIAPDRREGIYLSKFAQEDGFSLGAGVSLATVPDAGRAFSSKLFFLLSLPEVLLLQGQGQILKQRIGLDTTADPPFFAMIAVSSSSIEAAFGVDLGVPDSGEFKNKVARLTGVLEMGFFWRDASAWYINVGREEPEDQRISAQLFQIFNAYFYMMLSASGIRAGAGVSYKLKKRVGPFRVDLGAYLDVKGQISFAPPQIGGSIVLGGYLGFSIFGIGFRISAEAGLAAEAPKPFVITGKLRACVKILWKRRCLNLHLTWTFEDQLDMDPLPLLSGNIAEAVRAVNMRTGEGFAVYARHGSQLPNPASLRDLAIPMDSFIDLEFIEGLDEVGHHASLNRITGFGQSGATRVVPPERGKSSQVRHHFQFLSLETFIHNGNDWVEYDIYDAATPLQLADFVTSNLNGLPIATWQKQAVNKQNKLRILATEPFSYLREASYPSPPEDHGLTASEVFCPPEPRTETCIDFRGAIEGMREHGEFHRRALMTYRLIGKDGAVVWRHGAAEQALCFDEETTLELVLPEGSARVQLRLETHGRGIRIRTYTRRDETWKHLRTRQLTPQALEGGLTLESRTPIHRILIHVTACGTKARFDCKPDIKNLKSLELFLGQLFESGDAKKEDFRLYPEKAFGSRVKPLREHRYYHSLFRHLFPKQRRAKLITFKAKVIKKSIFAFEIADDLGKKSTFVLRTADRKSLAWGEITSISALNPLGGEDGEGSKRFSFSVRDGRRLRTIIGQTEFPTLRCIKVHEAEKPVNCDGLYEQAEFLREFLDRLVANRHLTIDGLDLFPEFFDAYTPVFFDSPLYPPGMPESGRVLYEALVSSKTRVLSIRIRDFRDYDCQIKIWPTEESVGFRHYQEIAHVLEIRPNPDGATDGANYHFILVVQLHDGQVVELHGQSCYPISDCYVGCNTYLHRVCYLSAGDSAYNETLPTQADVEDDAKQMVSALNGSIQPIWRPDSEIALRLTFQDQVTRVDDSAGQPIETKRAVIAFRTLGPLGHFHIYPTSGGESILPAYRALQQEDREDSFKLAGLRHYLDLPRCYPNADGSLNYAKPVYTLNPTFDLFSLEPYLFEMFRDWDAYKNTGKVRANLVLEILPAAPSQENPRPDGTEADWRAHRNHVPDAGLRVVSNMLHNGRHCVRVDTIKPRGVQARFSLPSLEPDQLYNTVYEAHFRPANLNRTVTRRVHSYVFKTSHYANFAAHIDSFVLARDDANRITRQAYFEVATTPDAAGVAEAATTLTNAAANTDDLKARYANLYDRLVTGCLNLRLESPALGTEVNRICDEAGRTYGLLVRSNEAFNDPKMPASELERTLEVKLANGNRVAPHAVMSRDAASIFVSNQSLDLPAGDYRLTFNYIRYDGRAYGIRESQRINFQISV